tara:strand:- start:2520 stop:2903 length:384 start_codon:yes stop_codon:yes gene_type:complete
MKTQIRSGHLGKFSAAEYTLLKSLALGLCCAEITKLIGLNNEQFESICSSLFQKLDAANPYVAVKNAFQKNYLNKKEFCQEELKSFSLEFAYKNIDQIKSAHDDPKQLLWELYDFLLEFNVQLEKKM